jgi:hypothetical protein
MMGAVLTFQQFIRFMERLDGGNRQSLLRIHS